VLALCVTVGPVDGCGNLRLRRERHYFQPGVCVTLTTVSEQPGIGHHPMLGQESHQGLRDTARNEHTEEGERDTDAADAHTRGTNTPTEGFCRGGGSNVERGIRLLAPPILCPKS